MAVRERMSMVNGPQSRKSLGQWTKGQGEIKVNEIDTRLEMAFHGSKVFTHPILFLLFVELK